MAYQCMPLLHIAVTSQSVSPSTTHNPVVCRGSTPTMHPQSSGFAGGAPSPLPLGLSHSINRYTTECMHGIITFPWVLFRVRSIPTKASNICTAQVVYGEDLYRPLQPQLTSTSHLRFSLVYPSSLPFLLAITWHLHIPPFL